jgi:hypothetical protein
MDGLADLMAWNGPSGVMDGDLAFDDPLAGPEARAARIAERAAWFVVALMAHRGFSKERNRLSRRPH